MSLRMVKLGSEAFEQLYGVPIGGLLSTTSAELLCSNREMAWARPENAVRRAQSQGCLIPDENVCSDSRYVDDVATTSKLLCASCILERQK